MEKTWLSGCAKIIQPLNDRAVIQESARGNQQGDEAAQGVVSGGIESIEDEDLIPRENIVITLTHNGYIKRLPVSTYRAQKRGGRGIQGMGTNDDDFVEHLITTSTHDTILFFTNK